MTYKLRFFADFCLALTASQTLIRGSLGLATALATQMRRIEGSHHVLSNLQFGSAILQVMAFQIPTFCWLVISYRPEIDVNVLRLFHDLSWFMLVGAGGQAVTQFVAVGLCILSDKRQQPIYPRWLGFFNLWMAVTAIPGCIVMLFKTGPFAWDGLFGFWVVLIGFGLWTILNYVYTVKAILRQQFEEAEQAVVT